MYLLCDNCGEVIKDKREGWIEYTHIKKNGRLKIDRIRVTHKDRRCWTEKEAGELADLPLSFFVDKPKLFNELKRRAVNKDDIDELRKRICEPGYEVKRDFIHKDKLH
jgi:hypothetical protein